MSERNLNFAGDVTINKIQLTALNGQTANITNQVSLIKIYEDLFSSFITMSLTLIESVDYINLFPFCGEEYVEIDIDTPSLNVPIRGRFYVNKIDDYIKVKDKEVAYTLRCVSEEWLTDANKKLTKPYSGNCAEIAAKLLGKEGLGTNKTITLERSSNSTKFIANYWRPSKCLNYVASGSVSVTNSPSFLFFENRNGFNFASIETIISNPNFSFQFSYDNYSRDVSGTTSSQNVNRDFRKIISYEVPVLSNYFEDIYNGTIKSRMITFDITTKRYASVDYSLKTDKQKHKLLNQNEAYSNHFINSPIANTFFVAKYSNNFSNQINVGNSNTIQKRMSFFNTLKRYSINIEVLGRTDYTVGMIVNIDIPKSTQIERNDDPRDLILSGRYLVSAICHTITRERHTCDMQIIKNSLLVNLNKK